MKKFILSLIALFCVIGLAAVWQLRQPHIQKEIALGLMPSGSQLDSILINGTSIHCKNLKIPLKDGNSIEIQTFRAQYDLWESIINRQIMLMDCHMNGCMLMVSPKSEASTLTQKNSTKAHIDAPWRMPQLKIPPLSIQRLQLTGILNVQDQLDSQFRLEAKNIGLDQVCELRLSANTKFETKQGIPIDQIETTLEGRFEMTTAGQIRLHNAALNAHSQDLTAHVDLHKSTDIKDNMLWQGTLYYTNETPLEYSLANTTAYVHNAKLILNGSAQLGMGVSIDQAELQLMTAPFGNIEIHSRKSFQYPLLADMDGELCSIRIPKLALSAFQQWLPSGYSLESDTVGSSFILSKDGDQYVLSSEQQIDWHAIRLMGPHGLINTWVDSLKMSPDFFFKPPENLKVSIPDLTISQKSKPVFITEIEAECTLSQLTACKVAADFSFMPDGIARYSVPQNLYITGTFQYQPSDEWPLSLASRLIQNKQTNTQDSLELRVQSQLAPLACLPIKVHALIGQQPTPKSEFQLDATLNLSRHPIQLSAQLKSPKSQLRDLQRWLEFFNPAPPPRISTRSKTQDHSQQAAEAQKSSLAIWGAVDAHITAHLQNLEINPKQVVSNVRFDSTISPQSLDIQDCTIHIEDAIIEATMHSDYSASSKPHYRNQLDVNLQNIRDHNFISNQQHWKIDGFFEGALSINGQADDYMTAWKNSLGHLSLRSQNGRLELLELSRRKSLGIAGAEILGFGLSAILDQPEIHNKTQAGIALVPYFKQIEYQLIELECVRQTLEIIDISKLQLLGPEIRIQGFGAIGAQPIQSIFQQPLLCELSLASKGPIIESLKILDFIEDTPDTNNFFAWKQQFEISGNLEELNTDSISDFFQQEARNLLRSPAQTDRPNKPDLNLEDGIDMIENLFSL